MKSTAITALMAAAAAAALTQAASADLLITEVSSKSAINPEDYFELTNTGSTAIDITGWRFDDVSALLADAVDLTGITSIAPGESVIFIGLDENNPADPAYDPAGEITTFRDAWGGLAGVQVGYHGGAGLGKNDAVTIFDAMDNIAASLAYGDTSPETTHAGDWAAGNFDGSDTFENDAAIWVPGTLPQQFVVAAAGAYGSFQNSEGEWGTPGFVPAPGAATLAVLAGVAAGRRRRRA